ncbi:glucan biosynthesis protein G [Pelagicoccus albus]|uniref:Glucans biosynthesis protein G n=1 Tax=Pelagicoccus albus TaxID=415222 RepID=A0A7X1B766_9BACT|nr:glucan biosynthesis protein G [Pelagicoccus albus]MBC2606782.1 glucan biosynthesis protein G [Pelagicoccus albus]
MCRNSLFGRAPLVAAATILLSGCASVDAMRRVEVDFEYVADLAEDLSKSPYVAPEPLPGFLNDLDYDAYRKIRYDADKYMWKDEGLPFSLGFFHPGFLHKNRLKVNEFTPTHAQHVRYLKEFFEFDDAELEARMPSSLDYAGLRLSYDAGNEGTDYREVASFLGASYFRGTGFDTRYGTSARGLAINSGLGIEEEFPIFREVWLGKPLGNSSKLVMYALLDGPSVTGAYEFVIRPGTSTVMEVKARVFLRESVESFGIAPLTSMYWRGENRTSFEHDYRPEVHDTDGLIVLEAEDSPLWRALDLSDKTRLSYFSTEELSGFGLMQRDRDFDSYQDLEAEYHNRPSVWIETKGDWGKGFVKLVELPTNTEFEDNVVAFWEPAILPEKGGSMEFEYDLHWSPEPAPEAYPSATVVSTRTGTDPSYPGSEVFVIEFSGSETTESPELLTAVEGAARMIDEQVVWNPYSQTWRVVLRLEPVEAGVTELRSQLLFPSGENSEVWAYQWTH